MSNYKTSATSLKKQLKEVEKQADLKLREAAQYLFFIKGNQPVSIELAEGELCIGEFETLINGYPSLALIEITVGKIWLKTEMLDEALPICEHQGLSSHDKLGILEILENKIGETLKTLKK